MLEFIKETLLLLPFLFGTYLVLETVAKKKFLKWALRLM